MLAEAALGLFLATIIWLYLRDGADPLDKLPGPPRLPIIDEFLNTLIGFTKSYGDRFCVKVFSVRNLHVVRPSDMEVILSHSKNITKNKAYQFLKDWLGNGLLLSTGTHWQKRRKILTPAFHFNILKNFATVMQERSKDLVNLLKKKNGAEVDLLPIISDFTLFTICETAMGTKLDEDKSAATVEYKNALLHIGLHVLKRVFKFWLWLDFVFKKTYSGKQYFKLLAIMRSFADNVIMDRKIRRKQSINKNVIDDEDLGTKKRLAMLDLLLEAEAKGEIDIDGIRDEVNTFMFEGHDTTALAITFGLMLLADYEDIQERIFWEVQGILNNTDHSPSMSDLADMKYMEAVIKEILRLYPSVPIIGRNIDEDFMLDDVLVKKGTSVDLHIYDLHHREDLFPEPEAFKPERFLPGNELKHPFAFVPFSAGPRNCIGQRFAMQEMKTAFCEIIRNFILVPKVKGARPRLVTDIVLRPVDPIYIKFIPR